MDIFEYWAKISEKTKIHPSDLQFLEGRKHSFQLDCIPTPYYGPLKTAPIVLLYLNPGLTKRDIELANDEQEQRFYWSHRQGSEPLRCQIGLASKSWWVSRTKRIEADSEKLRDKLAVLEICPYHSTSFNDWWALKSLRSCQVALGWAHSILFPQARKGERVVICLRGARHWGLNVGHHEGRLFVPRVNRGGFMFADGQRDLIVNAAREVAKLDLQ